MHCVDLLMGFFMCWDVVLLMFYFEFLWCVDMLNFSCFMFWCFFGFLLCLMFNVDVWYVDVLVCWYFHVLRFWYDVLMFWCFDALMYWCMLMFSSLWLYYSIRVIPHKLQYYGNSTHENLHTTHTHTHTAHTHTRHIHTHDTCRYTRDTPHVHAHTSRRHIIRDIHTCKFTHAHLHTHTHIVMTHTYTHTHTYAHLHTYTHTIVMTQTTHARHTHGTCMQSLPPNQRTTRRDGTPTFAWRIKLRSWRSVGRTKVVWPSWRSIGRNRGFFTPWETMFEASFLKRVVSLLRPPLAKWRSRKIDDTLRTTEDWDRDISPMVQRRVSVCGRGSANAQTRKHGTHTRHRGTQPQYTDI